jgi:Zn-dependent protease with chaperone function
MGISFLLGLITIPAISEIAEIAIMVSLLSWVLRRNELRADMGAAKAVSPEALIAVFESFKARFKANEGSDTHPSLQERIDRLIPLLDEDKRGNSAGGSR